MKTQNQNHKTEIENQINWREVAIHFGKKSGTKLGSMSLKDLKWWLDNAGAHSPGQKFCKSKLTEEKIIPAHHVEARPATEGFDDGDDWIEGDDAIPAHDVPERKIQVPIFDVEKCESCRLAAALKIAVEEKTAEEQNAGKIDSLGNRLAPLPAAGTPEFLAGEKIQKTVTLENFSSWEQKFNGAKTVQCKAILKNCDAKFCWKSGAMPDDFNEQNLGAEFEITGKIKDFYISEENEKIWILTHVKILNAQKIEGAVSLFCDGKSSADRIAVCDSNGEVIFCGQAGIGRPSDGDNTDHELSALLKALEIAAAAKTAAGKKYIAVEIKFDAQWMQNLVGKAKPARDFARENGLKVTMTHISGESNPADEWTIGGGEISKTVSI